MAAYEELGKHILKNGNPSGDRTGTGTRRITGGQLRFNLKEGFPMVTTKKVSLSFIAKELQWFCNGDTSQTNLKNDYKCTIWDEWADEHGRLGPIYGAMMVRRPAVNIELVSGKVDYREGEYLTDASAKKLIASNFRRHGQRKLDKNPVWKIYKRMINAVAANSEIKDTEIPKVLQVRSLAKEWLDFANFQRDFSCIPGNEMAVVSDECTWFFHTANLGRGLFAKDTLEFVETYKQTFASMACTSTILDYHEKGDYESLWKPRYYINQLQEAIDEIKSNPNSRRIIVDCWEPSLLPKKDLAPNEQASHGHMALAPCHCMFQFNVIPQGKGKKARLDLHLTQR